MKKITTTLIATVLVTTLGATAFVSTATARDRGMSFGPAGGFGATGMMCADEGAERLDRMLGNLADRADLSEEQTGLFDAFRSESLVAQTAVADVCAELELDEDADFMDRMAFGQAIMAIRLEAMDEVMPALEAFYDSLTEEQIAQIRPDNFERRGGMRGSQQGGEHKGGQMGNGAHTHSNN